VLHRLLVRRGRELKRRYANVLSVGLGYRTRGARRSLDTSEMCLRFLVARKWSGGRSKQGAIPDAVATMVQHGRRRLRCLVPTDVDVLGAGRPQAGLNLTRGLLARPAAGGPGLFGAVCCLVVDNDKPGRRLLLGCQHVFTRSLESAGCAAQADTVVDDAATGTRLGRVVEWASLGGPSKTGLDAALVELAPPAPDEVRLWGKRPLRLADQLELPPAGSRILVPAQDGLGRVHELPVTFVSQQFDLTVPYQCGRDVRLRWVFETIAETEPGDSGSPLVGPDPERTLYGMHFYETDEGRSLSIPAFELFRPGVFSAAIALP
jgi:hypothetical protein